MPATTITDNHPITHTMTNEDFIEIIVRAAGVSKINSMWDVAVNQNNNEMVITLPAGKGLLYPNLVPSIAIVRPVMHPVFKTHAALEIFAALSDIKATKKPKP